MDAKVSGARTACGYITTDSYLRVFRAGVSNETVLPRNEIFFLPRNEIFFVPRNEIFFVPRNEIYFFKYDASPTHKLNILEISILTVT